MRLHSAFFMALLTLTAASVLSGCRSENYFCDADGRFLCDGLGCREIDAPGRPTCLGDFQCTAGTVCYDIGCVTECTADSDCPRGTVCESGLCLNPGETTPTPNPGTCTRNDDCPDPDLICLDGVCQEDTSCGDEGCDCSDTGVCSTGFTCIDGTCRADDDTCQFNHECGNDRVCVNGECREGCMGSGGSTCPPGQVCMDDICRDEPVMTGQCADNSDCGTGEICVDSVCITGCSVDGDCSSDEYCLAGQCTYDDRPSPFCTSDADCQPGRPCVGGICRTPCDTSNECLMFDVQFRVCQQNFCVTSNEATSNCSLNSDCSGNDECVDGICI